MVEYSIKTELGFIYTYVSPTTRRAPCIFNVFIPSLSLAGRMLIKSSFKPVDLACQHLKYFCKAWH